MTPHDRIVYRSQAGAMLLHCALDLYIGEASAPMTGKPWHRDRRFVTLGRRIRALANANPSAVCWRDGLTLSEHRRRLPGVTLRWTAGHTGSRHSWRPWLNITQRPPLPGDWLAPEVSRCNYSAGAATGNGQRTNPTSRNW